MRRVPDTVDLWFDSGVSSWASLGYPARDDEFKRWWPQDWIVEGPDQTRGWFNSQLAAGAGALGRAPANRRLPRRRGHGGRGPREAKGPRDDGRPTSLVDQNRRRTLTG